MDDYSYDDIMRMQEEAKARVLEMRRRSRFAAENFTLPGGKRCAENEAPPGTAKAISYPVELPQGRTGEKQTPELMKKAQRKNGISTALCNVFGELSGEETENMFLLALCLLLKEENGDEGLLMALMYLLT